jgi:hypothetical protein
MVLSLAKAILMVKFILSRLVLRSSMAKVLRPTVNSSSSTSLGLHLSIMQLIRSWRGQGIRRVTKLPELTLQRAILLKSLKTHCKILREVISQLTSRLCHLVTKLTIN